MAVIINFAAICSCLLLMQISGVEATCDTHAFDLCLTTIQPFLDVWRRKIDSDYINASCVAFETVDVCIGAAGCSSGDTYYVTNWASYKDSFNLICTSTNGVQNFLDYQHCFDFTAFANGFGSCWNMNRPNYHANYHAFCNFYNRQLKCFANLVQSTACTSGSFITNLITRFLQAVANHDGYSMCTLSLSSNSESGSSHYQCDEFGIGACMASLKVYHFDSPLAQKLNRTQINSGCSFIAGTSDCVLNTAGCTADEDNYKLYWAPSSTSLTFLCGDGLQDFLNFETCFDVRGFTSGIQSCLSMNSPNEHANYHAWCNFYNRQEKCFTNLASTYSCTSKAFLLSFYTKYIQPLLSVRTQQCTISDTATLECDAIALQACVHTLDPHFFNPIAQQLNSTSEIDEGCGLLVTATTCVSINSGCTSSDRDYQLYWAGHTDSVTYICNDGRSDFIGYESCFDVEGFSDRLDTCLSMNVSSGANFTESEAWCHFYNDQMSCLTDLATRYICTSESFLSKFYRKYVQPELNIRSPGCQLNGGVSIHASIAIVVLVSFVNGIYKLIN